MLTEATLIRRPVVPEGLRVVRTEFIGMEYLGTPHGRRVTDGWVLVVFGEPHTITPEKKAELSALGFSHFKGRNAGTYRRKIAIRFED
jgi:hypothetical protein